MSAPPKRMDFSRHARRSLPTYENLFVEDEESRELYILLSGCLGIFRDEIKVAEIAEPLSIVGEISALTGSPRVATVRALEPSQLVVVEDPEALFAEYPQLAAKLAKILAQRLATMTHRFTELKGVLMRAESMSGVVEPGSDETDSLPPVEALSTESISEADMPTEKLPTIVAADADGSQAGEAEAATPAPAGPRLRPADVSDEMLDALQDILDLDPSVVSGS